MSERLPEADRWSESQFEPASPGLDAWLAARFESDRSHSAAESVLDSISVLLDDWPGLLGLVLGGHLDRPLTDFPLHALLSADDQVEAIFFEGVMTTPFETKSLVKARDMLSRSEKVDEETVAGVRRLYVNLPVIEMAGKAAASRGAVHAAGTVLAIFRHLPQVILGLGSQFDVDMRPVCREISIYSRIAAGEFDVTDAQLATLRVDSTIAWESLAVVARRPEPPAVVPQAKGGRPPTPNRELLALLEEFERSGLTQADFSYRKGRGFSRGSLSDKLKKAREIRKSSENVRETAGD